MAPPPPETRTALLATPNGMVPEDAIIFSSVTGEYGCFSNFKQKPFVDGSGRTFKSAEHYYHCGKAILMEDWTSEKKILEAKSPSAAKALGREISPFDQEKYASRHMDIMCDALFFKFSSEPEFKSKLLNTGNSMIVEGRDDRVWGSGLSLAKTKSTPLKSWKGPNKLGEALMELRSHFISENEDILRRSAASKEKVDQIQGRSDQTLSERLCDGTAEPDDVGRQAKVFDINQWELLPTPSRLGSRKGICGAFALTMSLQSQFPEYSYTNLPVEEALNVLKGSGRGCFSEDELAKALSKLTDSHFNLVVVTSEPGGDYIVFEALKRGEAMKRISS
ncbi:hypothetical protein IFR05_000098 [Cadophora sp. M221]|nr:hypothetical protein IFR05_000098 [Cadophora sp. M221]